MECYVALHIGTGPSHFENEHGQRLIVCGSERLSLRDDLWIERLNTVTGAHVQHACEPPHYKVDVRGADRHIYAFVMRCPPNQSSKYEGMAILQAVIALSRLVHPTSTGTRHCALIQDYGNDDSPVLAIEYKGGGGPDIYLGHDERDWLSREDGEVLRQLMPWAERDMPPRMHRAFWFFDYAMHTAYLDLRWSLVVAGLEALISIGEEDCARQFRRRVAQLARYHNIATDESEMRKAYKLRSKLIHAEGFLYGLGDQLPPKQHMALYKKIEDILRLTLRGVFLHESFAEHFATDEALELRWHANPPSESDG